MTKCIKAKHKIDRRLGINLWGRPKSPFNVRPSTPGQHGKRKGTLSDYGQQLQAKQKLKFYYGTRMGERRFHRYYEEAMRMKGDTGENLIGLLESRLSSAVYRSKMVMTPDESRQLISHGHIFVNGRRCTIPSRHLKPGDVVSLAPKSKETGILVKVQAAFQSNERDFCSYVEVDTKNISFSFLKCPAYAEVPYPVQMETNLVIEYYSR